MRLLAALLLSAALAGSAHAAKPDSASAASRAEAKLAAALAGRIPGKPVSCINLRDVRSSQIYDRTAIVYDTGTRLYVNRPTIGQESLDSDDILVSRTYSSELCSIDTIHLVDRGSQMQTGFVGLGDFVPYSRPPKQ